MARTRSSSNRPRPDSGDAKKRPKSLLDETRINNSGADVYSSTLGVGVPGGSDDPLRRCEFGDRPPFYSVSVRAHYTLESPPLHYSCHP